MANHFGEGRPIIYLDATPYTLQKMARSGREENFEKITKSWIDLDGNYQESVKGFRLTCRYRWDYIDNDYYTALIDIYNAESLLRLKFPSMPNTYPVKFTEFKHGLADGLNSADACEIELTGVILYKRYPSPDNIYSIPPLIGRGLIVIRIEE
jgi:hypothetical protein